MFSELTAVQQKNAELLSKVSSLEDAFKMMAREQTSSKDKAALLCQDVAALQARDAQSQKEFSALKKEFTADVKSCRGTVSTAQSELLSLRSSIDQHGATLKTFESNFGKLRTQVFFQALLHTNVRVKTKRVLILKDVLFDIGDGYSDRTGYFTAPLSGIYLFLATSASFKEEKCAKLDLVNEGEDKAFLGGIGVNCTTCHAAFWVGKGEKVWLRTFAPDEEDEEYCFDAGWKTSFSGVLLQPDI